MSGADLVTDTGATFSECGTYRYDLWRLWDESKPTLTFVMLNPSTADDTENDPTVERCQRRAIKGGYGQVRIVNLMAYRSTDPSVLGDLPRPEAFGPENERYLTQALHQAQTVICGWGKHGHLGPVAWFRRRAFILNVPLLALKLNADGSPRHPLYVPYSAKPFWFAGAEYSK